MFRKGVLCLVALIAISACIPTLSAQASSPAVLNLPSPGSTLAYSNIQFGWTAGTGVKQYDLFLGTTGVARPISTTPASSS